MKKSRRVVGAILATLTIATGGFASIPMGSAYADPGCAQMLSPFRYGGNDVAQVCIQHIGTADQTVTLTSLGQYYGVSKFMSVKACKAGPSGEVGACGAADAGTYAYYAGPVDAGCSFIYAVMYDGNGNKIVDGRRATC